MGGPVLYLLLISQSALTAELPQLLSLHLSVKLVQNKHVQQGQVAFTSLSHVPRVHTILSFNALRKGG